MRVFCVGRTSSVPPPPEVNSDCAWTSGGRHVPDLGRARLQLRRERHAHEWDHWRASRSLRLLWTYLLSGSTDCFRARAPALTPFVSPNRNSVRESDMGVSLDISTDHCAPFVEHMVMDKMHARARSASTNWHGNIAHFALIHFLFSEAHAQH